MLLIIQVPVVPTSWILRISFGSLAKLQVIQSHLLHFLPRSFFPSAWTHFPPLISSRPRPSGPLKFGSSSVLCSLADCLVNLQGQP